MSQRHPDPKWIMFTLEAWESLESLLLFDEVMLVS